jgi:hypothetical protein
MVVVQAQNGTNAFWYSRVMTLHWREMAHTPF